MILSSLASNQARAARTISMSMCESYGNALLSLADEISKFDLSTEAAKRIAAAATAFGEVRDALDVQVSCIVRDALGLASH
jgi:hypothetical protein